MIVLLRTTDWLAPWISLDHTAWESGLQYAPWDEAVIEPRLSAPWLSGLALSPAVEGALVIARTALAVMLLVGVRARSAALALGLVGHALMASDRFRYLHHLYWLWCSCLLFAAMPSGARLSSGPVPRAGVQVLRGAALIVWSAAGLAKLRAEWLDGSILRYLEARGLLFGPARAVADAVGHGPLAMGIAAAELALVPLLILGGRARLLGVALGLALHAGIDASMHVSTFGAQMTLFLSLFLPWREHRYAPPR